MNERKSVKNIIALVGVALVISLGLFALGCGEKEPPKPKPECSEDLDCPQGKACQGGKCITKIQAPPPPECVSAEDCSDDKICVSGKCKYECSYDSDCSVTEACENNRCKEKPQCEVQTVYFDFDEYYLTSSSQSTLRANAQCIKEKKVTSLVIEGHCDERGSVEYNLALGQKRAQSVRDFLVDMGLDASSVKIISYGEERPLSYGHDEESWAKNRRGETNIK